MEPLRAADRMAKAHHGAPGLDGVPCEAIAASGVAPWRAQRPAELGTRTDRPRRVRQQALPQAGGTPGRVLARPTRRDRGGQGALKRLLGPIFAAACQPGSSGYRPTRSAHDAVRRVAEAMGQSKPRVSDVAVPADFATLRHPLLLAPVAQRGKARAGLHVRQRLRQAAGTKGGAPGGVRSP